MAHLWGYSLIYEGLTDLFMKGVVGVVGVVACFSIHPNFLDEITL